MPCGPATRRALGWKPGDRLGWPIRTGGPFTACVVLARSRLWGYSAWRLPAPRPRETVQEDSPVNGTSATMSRLASDSWAGWKSARAPGGGFRNGCLSPCGGVFLAAARTLSESGLMAASVTTRVRLRSKAVNVDCGQFVRRRVKDVAIVIDLHELTPVGRPDTAGGTRSVSRSRNSNGEITAQPSSSQAIVS